MRAALLRGRTSLLLGGGRLVGLMAFAHVVNDGFAYSLSVFLPTLQARFGLGEAVLAGLVTLVALSSNFAQGVSGGLVDRWGRRRSAALGVLMVAVMMSFVPSIPAAWMLIPILLLGGFGSALFHPSAASLARHAVHKGGAALGVFGAGGTIGVALFPIAALAILNDVGPGGVQWLAWGGVVAALMLLLAVPPQQRIRPATLRRPWDLTNLRGRQGTLLAVGSFQAVADLAFLSSMPLLLTGVWGYSGTSAVIGTTLASYQVGAAVGAIGLGMLDGVLGRRLLVSTSLLASFPLLVLTAFLNPAAPWFLVVVALAGATGGSVIPLLVAQAQDEAPGRVGTATGMQLGVTWGIAGVAYLGVGALQQGLGLPVGTMLAYAAMLPAVLLMLRVSTQAATGPDEDVSTVR